MNPNQPYLVGVSGGSASGKTYLLTQLLEAFPSDQITLISQDNYYRPFEEQEKAPDGSVNFDHPKALDLDQFAKDLKRVINGETIEVTEYLFNNPNKTPRIFTYRPTPIIIVEGLFVFYHQPTSDLLNLKIFVDADEHIKLSRRIIRDAEERGYPLEEVLEMYTDYVMPMYKKFIEPFKWDCDLIFHNNSHINMAIRVLIDHFESELVRKGIK